MYLRSPISPEIHLSIKEYFYLRSPFSPEIYLSIIEYFYLSYVFGYHGYLNTQNPNFILLDIVYI